jgi:hypothetical protein
MFRILFCDNESDAGLGTYDNAKDANEAARKVAIASGRKARIARVISDAWRAREAGRLATGVYKPLPDWFRASWFYAGSDEAAEHFAHMSTRDESGARIAWTESAEKGDSDRQTVASVSRYLARYFGPESNNAKLSSQEISEIAARFSTDEKPVRIEFDPDIFEAVYSDQDVCAEASSYSSCMRYRAGHFGTPHHPARAYATDKNGLAIAWLQEDESADPVMHASNFRVLARAVVWPARKSFVRVYGTSESWKLALAQKLEAQGYTRARGFGGAKLDAERHRDGWIVPYVDGSTQRGYHDGSHIVISDGGSLELDETDGWTTDSDCDDDEESGYDWSCERCGEGMSDGEDRTEVDDEAWCDACAERYAFCSDRSGTYSRNRNRREVNVECATEDWTAEEAESDAFMCARNGERYSTDDFGSIEVVTARDERGRVTEESWCRETAEEDEAAFQCAHDGAWYACDAFTRIEVNGAAGIETWCEVMTREIRIDLDSTRGTNPVAYGPARFTCCDTGEVCSIETRDEARFARTGEMARDTLRFPLFLIDDTRQIRMWTRTPYGERTCEPTTFADNAA